MFNFNGVIKCIEHVLQLINYGLSKFSIVGTSGISIYMFTLHILISDGIPAPLANLLAMGASIISNFVLNDVWIFNSTKRGDDLKRMLNYCLSLLSYVIVNFPAFILLIKFSLHILFIGLTGICWRSTADYIAATNFTWRFR